MSFDQIIADAELANQAAVMLATADLSSAPPILPMTTTTISGSLGGVSAGNGLRDAASALQTLITGKAHGVEQIAATFAQIDTRLAEVLRG